MKNILRNKVFLPVFANGLSTIISAWISNRNRVEEPEEAFYIKSFLSNKKFANLVRRFSASKFANFDLPAADNKFAAPDTDPLLSI